MVIWHTILLLQTGSSLSSASTSPDNVMRQASPKWENKQAIFSLSPGVPPSPQADAEKNSHDYIHENGW
jgi:hypothetical protein